MGKLLRRDFIMRSTQVLSVAALIPITAKAQQQCVEVSSEELRESLNYQDPGPDPKKHCKDCGFFQLDRAPCGQCQIMTGPVNASAYCDSWSVRSAQ
jgi:High potential iron-sulfur protein